MRLLAGDPACGRRVRRRGSGRGLISSSNRFFFTDSSLERYRAEAQAAGWSVASFHAREKAALLEEAARELGFRADFGKNWDAFADALDELAWQERKLLLVFAQSLDSPDELQILLEILAEAFPPRDETPNAQLKVLFSGSKITAFDFDWQPLP